MISHDCDPLYATYPLDSFVIYLWITAAFANHDICILSFVDKFGRGKGIFGI